MATKQGSATSEILSLASLPPELHLHIISYLDPMSRQLLRTTSRYFRRIVPPLSHGDRVEAEQSAYARKLDVLACRACNRLRHRHAFDREMRRKESFQWRFCVECGSRLLVEDAKYDELKYMYGDRWIHGGKTYGRCARCEDCKAWEWKHKHGGQNSSFEVCGGCKPFGEGEIYYNEKRIKRAVDERVQLVRDREPGRSSRVGTGGPPRSRRRGQVMEIRHP